MTRKAHRRHVGLTRVLRLMERLKVRRATLRELAVEHEVSERTIRRDLATMSLVGLPVRNTADLGVAGPDIQGFWWIER